MPMVSMKTPPVIVADHGLAGLWRQHFDLVEREEEAGHARQQELVAG